jgi:hypothetical protein
MANSRPGSTRRNPAQPFRSLSVLAADDSSDASVALPFRGCPLTATSSSATFDPTGRPVDMWGHFGERVDVPAAVLGVDDPSVTRTLADGGALMRGPDAIGPAGVTRGDHRLGEDYDPVALVQQVTLPATAISTKVEGPASPSARPPSSARARPWHHHSPHPCQRGSHQKRRER